MKHGTIIMILLAVGFAGLLPYSMLSAQQVECSACVTFEGQSNCATVCGTISQGMDGSIRCSNTPPTRAQCRNR